VLEKNLIEKIRKYLAGLDGCFFWKEHGGQYGTAGIPDIIICYNGRFVALEVKVGKNKPTRLQAATIEQIQKAGGTAEVVYSLEDAKKVIGG
jgi:Holliday junction resolvase